MPITVRRTVLISPFITCLILCFGLGLALMPPHPDLLKDPDFQADQREWRRRMQSNQHIYSQTKLLHPDSCQHVDIDECLQADRFMLDQARSIRKLAKATGKLRALVLLLQFPEHKGRELPTREELNLLLNGEGTDPILYPTGSVKGYIDTSSYGKLDLQMDIPLDWTLTDDSMEHYSYNRSGVTPLFTSSFNPLLEALDESGINWADYDQDGDGRIDSIIVLHSSFPAERGGAAASCGGESDPRKRIWSHAIGWNRSDAWTSKDGKVMVGSYMTTSALRGVCTSDMARIGTATHELFHTWGLPDLYDSNGFIGRGTGMFDIMGHPYGMDGSGNYPGFLSPWSSMELGWLDPVNITTNGKYTLGPVQTTGQAFRINQGFPHKEYLLIENRQAYLWDELLWGGGILIWHIDERAKRQRNRGYPGQEGWPGNGMHYTVALVQGDGKFDLEVGTNHGDADDFFVKGKELRPGPGVEVATDASLYPNTDAYQHGNINITGIRIFNFSPSQEDMTFEVSGLAPAVPTPPPVPVTPPPTLTPTELPTRSPTSRPSLLPTTLSPTATPSSSTPEPTSPLPTSSPTGQTTPSPVITTMPTPRPTSTFAPTSTTPLPTSSPTAQTTPSATTTDMPSPRPTATFAPTTTTAPTQWPTVTAHPTGTYRPSQPTVGVVGDQQATPSSEVNVGLAVGLALLFTVIAAIVGYWIWKVYYKKPKKSDLVVKHTRVPNPANGDEEEGGMGGIAIGVECSDDIESGTVVSESDSSLVKAIPLTRTTSVASTVSDASSANSNIPADSQLALVNQTVQEEAKELGNNVDLEQQDSASSTTGETAEAGTEAEVSTSVVAALQRQDSTESTFSQNCNKSSDSNVMTIDNAIATSDDDSSDCADIEKLETNAGAVETSERNGPAASSMAVDEPLVEDVETPSSEDSFHTSVGLNDSDGNSPANNETVEPEMVVFDAAEPQHPAEPRTPSADETLDEDGKTPSREGSSDAIAESISSDTNVTTEDETIETGNVATEESIPNDGYALSKHGADAGAEFSSADTVTPPNNATVAEEIVAIETSAPIDQYKSRIPTSCDALGDNSKTFSREELPEATAELNTSDPNMPQNAEGVAPETATIDASAPKAPFESSIAYVGDFLDSDVGAEPTEERSDAGGELTSSGTDVPPNNDTVAGDTASGPRDPTESQIPIFGENSAPASGEESPDATTGTLDPNVRQNNESDAPETATVDVTEPKTPMESSIPYAGDFLDSDGEADPTKEPSDARGELTSSGADLPPNNDTVVGDIVASETTEPRDPTESQILTLGENSVPASREVLPDATTETLDPNVRQNDESVEPETVAVDTADPKSPAGSSTPTGEEHETPPVEESGSPNANPGSFNSDTNILTEDDRVAPPVTAGPAGKHDDTLQKAYLLSPPSPTKSTDLEGTNETDQVAVNTDIPDEKESGNTDPESPPPTDAVATDPYPGDFIYC